VAKYREEMNIQPSVNRNKSSNDKVNPEWEWTILKNKTGYWIYQQGILS
jgi:hypothetical protein